MSPADREGQLDTWLFSECQETGRKISSLISLDERLIGIGATLLIAAATVAVSNGFEEVLVGLPVAYGALLCFVFYLHGETMALAGYKAALEEHLAHRVGRPVIVWESKVAPCVRTPLKDPSILIAFIVMGALYLGAATAAGIEAWHFGGKGWRERNAEWIFGGTLVVIVVTALAVSLAYVGAATRSGKSRKRTAEAFGEAPKPDARVG